MQLVILKKQDKVNHDRAGKVAYMTFYEGNSAYLEREGDDNFNVLNHISTSSPIGLKSKEDFLLLIADIEKLKQEAKDDPKMINFLLEVLVLCKVCLFYDGLFWLEITPWGVPLEEYPEIIPEKYRFNIADLN